MKLFDALDYFNRQASDEFVSGKLAQLRAVMARSNESNNDIQLVIATYAEHLSQYPADIVAYVIDRTIATKKWFPLVSELRKEMDSLVRFRREILKCFEECRNPLLAEKKKQKQIAADPRLQMHWKELDKKDWLDCHWEWYIGAADEMEKTNKEHGREASANEWRIIAEERRTEMLEHEKISRPC